MVKVDSPFREICIWCIAALVALIPLVLLLVWLMSFVD